MTTFIAWQRTVHHQGAEGKAERIEISQVGWGTTKKMALMTLREDRLEEIITLECKAHEET